MLDRLLATVAPHLCMYCLRPGALICLYCEYDIIQHRNGVCIACGKRNGGELCPHHQLPYQKSWCFGERRDALEYLIDELKLKYKRAAATSLARLLQAALPDLPAGAVFVPVPTASSHIRERGFDHTYLIAKQLGRFVGRPVKQSLSRHNNTVQRGSTREQRLKQAKGAFICPYRLDPLLTYIVIDDVVTTGATVGAAVQALRRAGAKTVWVAVIAYEPLD